MDILLWLAAGSAILLYWLDTAKARETAIFHSRKACRDMKLQFLDGTVARYKTRLARSPGGQLCLMRHYRFEFTSDGHQRWYGYARLCGSQLQLLDLDRPCAEEENSHRHLIIADSPSEGSDAIRSRVEKRPDCYH